MQNKQLANEYDTSQYSASIESSTTIRVKVTPFSRALEGTCSVNWLLIQSSGKMPQAKIDDMTTHQLEGIVQFLTGRSCNDNNSPFQ